LGKALTILAAREGLRIVHINPLYNDNMVHVTYYYETLEEEENRLYPSRVVDVVYDKDRWSDPLPWDDEPTGFVVPGQPDVPFEEYRPLYENLPGFDENVMDDDGAPPLVTGE